jgi:hypothetical protein
MKKALLIAAVAGFVMTSCKKDYTCECTSTVGTITSTASTTINGKKDDVKTACEAGNSSASVGGVTSSVKCEIK